MSPLRHPQPDLLPLAKIDEFPTETTPPTPECNVTILSVFPEGQSVMSFFLFLVVFQLMGLIAKQTRERPVILDAISKVNDLVLLVEVTKSPRQRCMSLSSKVKTGMTSPT